MGTWKQISVIMMEGSMKATQNNAQKKHVVSNPRLYANWKWNQQVNEASVLHSLCSNATAAKIYKTKPLLTDD